MLPFLLRTSKGLISTLWFTFGYVPLNQVGVKFPEKWRRGYLRKDAPKEFFEWELPTHLTELCFVCLNCQCCQQITKNCNFGVKLKSQKFFVKVRKYYFLPKMIVLSTSLPKNAFWQNWQHLGHWLLLFLPFWLSHCKAASEPWWYNYQFDNAFKSTYCLWLQSFTYLRKIMNLCYWLKRIVKRQNFRSSIVAMRLWDL